MLQIKSFTLNMIEENCYVVSDETNAAVIIDDGAYYPGEAEAINEYVQKQNLRLVRSLATHAHFDHVWGTMNLYETYGLKTDFHTDDVALYDDFEGQMQMFFRRNLPLRPAPAGILLHEGDRIPFGNHELQVIATPGHTPGGICLHCAAEQVLFSGDSLFRGSVGRTDFPGGDHQMLLDSIKSKLLTLPDETVVYPGHGPATTIKNERETNPYL